ncbi:MAG: glycosyl transferase [Thermoleophilia bacterium]
MAAALRRRRLRRRARARRRRRAALAGAALLVLLPATLAVAGLAARQAFRSSCSLHDLRPVPIGQTSLVYAADGSLLGAIPAERNRQPVPLRQVSPWMRKATVAVEDRRFYEHGGIDYEGIARALWRDVTAQKVVEGGSTLTQQLVRNLYISREQTLTRKLREACLAIELSRAWSKERILQEWLNSVYFGNHAYGVEAAAQTYFSKPARSLTLLEAALLAGLPQAPSRYDPFLDPQAALARRDVVLRAMLENGDITQEQLDRAIQRRDLGLRPGQLYTRIREPYFFSYVRDQLIAEYGASTVRSGGLRVYTTISPAFQRAAEDAIARTLDRPGDPAAALVSVNPSNGAIRAMTSITPGGRGSEFNLATQARRQAGSTFKTFVLTAAVEAGIDPSAAVYVSAPFTYQPSDRAPVWRVSTYDGTYAGPISVRRATLRSDNTVYAQLTLDVGSEAVAATARKLGVRTALAAVPSIGLGSLAVSPLDMASAYATLAAGGIYSQPMAIRRVVLPSGREDKEVGWGKPRRKRVVPDGVAYVVTKILEENILYGTGTRARLDRPAAGKTGTTDDHADAWFCGYTPNLATAVWVGYPQAEIPMENVHGIAVTGGSFPAEIWGLFMRRVLRYSPPQDWPEPRQPPVWKPFQRGPRAIPVPVSPPARPEPARPSPAPERRDVPLLPRPAAPGAGQGR